MVASKILKGLVWASAGLTACLLLLVSGGLAQAGEGYVIYDAHDVSGYHLTVLASPNPVSVGKIHLLIRVARPSGVSQEAPVTGARVQVSFDHVQGPGADNSASYLQRRDLMATASEPGTYELDDSLQNEGTYQIGLLLDINGQQVHTSFPITAKPEPDDRLMSVLLLSLFPLFLGWLVWMYLKNPGPSEEEKSKTAPETVAVKS